MPPISDEVMKRAEASRRYRELAAAPATRESVVRVLTADGRPTVRVYTTTEEFIDGVVRFCYGCQEGNVKHEWEIEKPQLDEGIVANPGAGTNILAGLLSPSGS